MRTILLGFLLVSCLAPPLSAGEADHTPGVDASAPFIGLALPSRREERWTRDLAAVTVEASKLGVRLLTRIANNDQEEQDRHIDEMIEAGVSVIMVAAHDTTAVAGAVRKARGRGIKILAYDRLILECDYELYAGFDSVEVGRIQGRWMTARVPKGNYLVMSGAPTDANAALFRRGVDEILTPFVERGDINIVEDRSVTDWLPTVARQITLDVLDLRKGLQLDAIIAPNDGTAGGVADALEARGLSGKIPVAGHDGEAAAAQRIILGTQSMTVLKDTGILGREAVRLAVRLAKGEAISTHGATLDNGAGRVPAFLIAPIMVDSSNIKEILFDSGYLYLYEEYK